MGTPINVIKQYLVQFHEGRRNSQSMYLFLKYSYLYLFTNSPWKLLKFRLAKNFNSKTFCFCVASVFDRGVTRKLDPSFLFRFRSNFLDEPTWKQSLRRRLFIVILVGDQKDRWRAWAFGAKEKRAASLSERLSHLRERNK